MRIWTVLGFLSVGLLAAEPALAGGKGQNKERDAKKACLSGNVTKGISILADLFVDTGDANFLYNQGRCYEQNVRYTEAAERFKEYLRKAVNLTDKEKAEVDKHIADCEAAVAKGQARGTASSSQPSSPAPEAAPPVYAQTQLAPSPPTAYLPPAPTVAAPAAPVAEQYGWQHTAKWVASGAAVAFLGFGVVEHLSYYSKNSDYNKNPSCPTGTPSACNSLASSADTAQTLAIVGYGAAAAATGAAIVFWLTDSPRLRPADQARFTCVPALAGISCQGWF